MNVPEKTNHLLRGASLIFLTWLLSACDSSSGVVVDSIDSVAVDSIAASGPSVQIADIDLDNLDQQTFVAFDADPSLGFALPPNGRIHARTGSVGSANGGEFELSCSNNQILAGVIGHHSHRIERLQAVCVSSNNNGDWVGNPVPQQLSAGSNNGTPFTRNCPAGHAVTGISSDFANNFPIHLQVHCRKLDGQRETTGANVSLDPVGFLGNGAPFTTLQCADRAVATGIYGNVQSSVERMGLVCYEDPAFAGRWSSQLDWPHISIHNIVLSDGKVLTYGTGGSGVQGALEYDVWDPAKGIGQSSHNILQGISQVDSFCGAANLLPGTGNVLLPAGDARPFGRVNAGVRDAVLFNANDESISRAEDMEFERWYPTSTMLPDGDILVVGGRDGQLNNTPIPEVYSTETGSWRSLGNASTAAYSYFYPRQFVMPDGRVFGMSDRDMFFISTDGSGSLTDAGDMPNYAFGSTGTAAMYEPGKILYVGGAVDDGKGAAIVDVTSGTPVITQADDLAEPRRAWASAVLLADGKVMTVGGSYITNEATTASLGAESWDPATETWTQYSRSELPRLYHSTAVLLMDGKVLLAGGGSPGPLNNNNAEIFSPPYLFDENGALAARPEITEAPEIAAWGQNIGIRTSNNSDISRITLLKTGSITHGFNMDQRFLQLPFSVEADSLSVTMPASGNLAPPGFYMMFVHDSNGTPSTAKMIDLGSIAAPSLTSSNPRPEAPPITASTLLSNGGFEQGEQGWSDCAGEALTSPSSLSAEGQGSLQVSTGGCMFQVVPVQAGANYTMNCHARSSAQEYTSLSLQMLDAEFAELANSSIVVESQNFELQTASLEAVAGTNYAAVTMYSEGTAHFDRCELLLDSAPAVQPPAPVVSPTANLLSNGDFEQGKASWFDCSQPALTSASTDAANGSGALQVENAGCIYQEFPLTPGKTYQLSCLSKSEATNYSSLSLSLMTDSYATLASDIKPVGQNFFQNYQTQLFTPIDGRIGAVTLYSEDRAQFDDCAVIEL